MARKSSRRRSSKQRPRFSFGDLLPLLLLVLSGVVLFSLVWFVGTDDKAKDRLGANGGDLPIRNDPEIVTPVESVPVVREETPGRPRVAIIMDDLGRDFLAPQTLLSLAEPVAFAILPDQGHSRDIAEMVYLAGREVLLHVPMEPQAYPEIDPGNKALMVAQSHAEIQRRFRDLLELVPHAVGVNNHMGSRFTEEGEAMSAVMEVVRERSLFFVDSRTTANSLVVPVADRYQVAHLKRDVFLDNVAEVEAIAEQIGKLVEKARSRGYAVGICHPYPETLEALGRELPLMAERGVDVVTISSLIGSLDN
ncbi:MAG: hypothetical protein C0614_08415 [Desulfuromonas sp.]|nr:MAG: hypothetical protein C0614_08415 [Desulfuromonas sp.]